MLLLHVRVSQHITAPKGASVCVRCAHVREQACRPLRRGRKAIDMDKKKSLGFTPEEAKAYKPDVVLDTGAGERTVRRVRQVKTLIRMD